MASTTAEIKMPQMGESVTEGTVLEWHKQVGDPVEAEETVVEVSTDKVDAEVPAPVDGVITEILVAPDETVPAGTVLAEVGVGAEAGCDGAGPDGASAASSTGAATAADGATEDRGEVPTAPDTGESVVEEAEHGAAAEAEHGAAAEAAAERGPATAASAGQLVDVTLPQMGESVSKGTVLEWRKQVGEPVAADETVVEVSTDKVDAEVRAPASGTIAEILVAPDEVVKVGEVLCRIAVGDQATRAGAPAATPPPAEAPARPPAESSSRLGVAADGAATGNGAAATPVAARIASAHGIDLSAVSGSGPRGRITKEDVLAALEGDGGGARPEAAERPATEPAPSPTSPSAPPTPGQRPLRGPAATLARFMNESRSIPTATSFRTLSVDTLDARRRALKEAGRRLSFTHLIAWAIVEAAREMPVMAHAYAETDGKPQVVEPTGINLGLAVDVERRDGSRSLVTPVVHDAGSLELPTFVARYDELVNGARDGTLPPEAYTGANITLTNPGGIGTVASVPRLMPGQGTIVATGAIGYPPGLELVDATRLRELGVSKTMTTTSTYDHRVIQGAQSGAFLRRIDELLAGADGFYEAVARALGADVPTEAEAAEAAGRPRASRRRGRRPGDVLRAGHLARHPRPPRANRRRDAPGRPGRDVGGQGPPHARPPVGPARPARLRARGRPGARPAQRPPDTGAHACDPRLRAAHRRPRPDLRRGAPPAPEDLLRDDRLRVRAHLEPRRARVAATDGGVGRAPQAARAGGEAPAARTPDPHRGARELPPQGVPRAQAVLDRGHRHARADARRDDRARGRRRRPRGADRHGPSRAPQRARPQRRPPVRVDPRRVRGRADARGRDRHARGRHGRRQVPPRRRRHLPDPRRARDHRLLVAQPEPSRVRRPGRRGSRARRPDEPQDARAPPRPDARPAGAHPRRRRVPGPGDRRRDAEPARAARLHDRRHRPHHHQQPARLHDRALRGPLDPLPLGPRQGVRHPDHPRERRRRRGMHRRGAPRHGLPRALPPQCAHRPRRLPPLRPQRDRRARVHPAAHVRADQGAPARPVAVRRPARRRERGDRPGGRAARGGGAERARRGAFPAQGV